MASAISFLVATAAHIMHLTNGQLTYIPEGHCVNITIPKHNLSEVNLVINDPIGAGWRILRNDINKAVTVPNIMSKLEILIEFSSKCVIHAIVKSGLDNEAMNAIVDSASSSSSSSLLFSESYLSPPRMAVLTSGNSTVTGLGSSTTITEESKYYL